MPAQNGRTLVIKKSNNDSPETFTAIAAAQEKSLSISNGEIDITSDDDAGRVARLGGGNTDVSISISGVAVDETEIQLAIANTATRYQVEWTDTGATLTGTFEYANYDVTGSTADSAIQFSASLRPTLGTWAYAT